MALCLRAPSLYASPAAAAPELSRTAPGPAPAASAPGSWPARAPWVRGGRQTGRGRADEVGCAPAPPSLPTRLLFMGDQVLGPGQTESSARLQHSREGVVSACRGKGYSKQTHQKSRKGMEGWSTASPFAVPASEPTPVPRPGLLALLRTRRSPSGALLLEAAGLAQRPFLANLPVFSPPPARSRRAVRRADLRRGEPAGRRVR